MTLPRQTLPGGLALVCTGCLSIAGLDDGYRAGDPGATGAGSPTTTGTQTGVPSGGGSGTTGSGGDGSGADGAGGHGAAGLGGAGGGSAGTGGSSEGGGPPAVLDTVVVDCANPVATSSNITLLAGVSYLLRASGDCQVTEAGARCDAEWMNFDLPSSYSNDQSVDMGLAVNDTSVDFVKEPNWGSYDPWHIYELSFIGQGAPITLQFHDPVHSNNDGSLTLEIVGYP